MDKEKFDRLLKILQFILGTFVIGLFTIFVNWQIQSRQIETEEMEQLGKFIEHAINENPTVRFRFAEYFEVMSRSESFRERWQNYKSIIEKEIEQLEQEKKQKRVVEQALEDEVKRISAEIDQKASEDTEAIKQLQDELVQKDVELANIKNQLNTIQADLTYAPQELAAKQALPIRSKKGWVYLGEYDNRTNQWIKRYWDIGNTEPPLSLDGKRIQVIANAINVRADSDPWAKIIGSMNTGQVAEVEEVNKWGLTGYYWAKVSY